MEAALLKLPTVIIYKVAALSYLIGKIIVKIPYISLPNIVAGRKIVPELVQGAANPDNIASEALPILIKPDVRNAIINDLGEMRGKLGTTGAVERVAQEILTVAHRMGGGKQ